MNINTNCEAVDVKRIMSSVNDEWSIKEYNKLAKCTKKLKI